LYQYYNVNIITKGGKNTMKRTLLKSCLAVALVTLSIGATAAAAPVETPPQTDITGVISKDGATVAGAEVTIVCKGLTVTDTTDAHGSYLGVYELADCPIGSNVEVTAMKGGYSGNKIGTVNGVTTKLNIAIINVSIPEYGLIGAIAAGGVGTGALLMSRRRQARGMAAA
jgi:hypothetical protein